MDLSKKYRWLLVIFGMFFVSLVISLIFLLINKCISKRGKHRLSQLQRGSAYNVESNKYQERKLDTVIPPLPPRTQFLTAVAQSYENLAEGANYEDNIDDYQQSTDNDEHDYEEALPGREEPQPVSDYEEAFPNYVGPLPDNEEALPNYEDALPDYEDALGDYVEATPDYEEPEEEQPDYVKVDDEERVLLTLPPDNNLNPAEDDDSTEDYDDIGAEDENETEEDYDDVG